jgi:hypothetical protein
MMRCTMQRSEGLRVQSHRLTSEHAGGDGLSIMGNRGLLLNGNAGGASAGDGGETAAFLRGVLVSVGLLLAGAILRRGR